MIPSLDELYPLDIAPLLGENNVLPLPIGVKEKPTQMKNLIWKELNIMEVRRHFYHISNCGLDGWHTLSFIRCGFVGVPGLLQTLDVMVHVVELIERFPS